MYDALNADDDGRRVWQANTDKDWWIHIKEAQKFFIFFFLSFFFFSCFQILSFFIMIVNDIVVVIVAFYCLFYSFASVTLISFGACRKRQWAAEILCRQADRQTKCFNFLPYFAQDFLRLSFYFILFFFYFFVWFSVKKRTLHFDCWLLCYLGLYHWRLFCEFLFVRCLLNGKCSV